MILVTGDAGFIGGHVRRTLESQGKTVVGLEKDDVPHFIDGHMPMKDIELIIHNGAISSTTETNLRNLLYYNVDMTLTLFERAAAWGIPVKYASTAAVYGNDAYGNVSPLNQYAVSKLQIDYWVQENLDLFPLIQGFRYFNVYGPGERHKGDQASPVSKFSWQARESGVIKVFEGSEYLYRDFIWVGDVVDLVLNNTQGSGIFDLGTGEPVSFQHVAERVADRFGGRIKTVPFPEHLENRYQRYTCAKTDIWPVDKFPKTIKEYLSV